MCSHYDELTLSSMFNVFRFTYLLLLNPLNFLIISIVYPLVTTCSLQVQEKRVPIQQKFIQISRFLLRLFKAIQSLVCALELILFFPSSVNVSLATIVY